MPSSPLIPEHHIYSSFQCLQGQQVNCFPASLFQCLTPLLIISFLIINVNFPLVQFEAISSCLVSCYLVEEVDNHLVTISFQMVTKRALNFPLTLLFTSRLKSVNSLNYSSWKFFSRPFTISFALSRILLQVLKVFAVVAQN